MELSGGQWYLRPMYKYMYWQNLSTVNSLINTPGAMTCLYGMHPGCGGHFHLPEAFYGMKIEQLLAEIRAKTWKFTQIGSGKTRGAFIGGGAFIGEFTVYLLHHALCECSLAPKWSGRGKKWIQCLYSMSPVQLWFIGPIWIPWQRAELMIHWKTDPHNTFCLFIL